MKILTLKLNKQCLNRRVLEQKYSKSTISPKNDNPNFKSNKGIINQDAPYIRKLCLHMSHTVQQLHLILNPEKNDKQKAKKQENFFEFAVKNQKIKK